MSIHYYQNNAQTFFDSTVHVDMSSLYSSLTQHLEPGARILDAGCGSGRDSKALLEMGYQVEAFDASSAMVKLARQYAGIEVALMTFADVSAQERYDGIWCCASLLHVALNDLPQVMRKLTVALRPGGYWYTSFKYGDGERELDGRQFTDLNEDMLNTLVAPLPLHLSSLWITQDKRPGRDERWLNAILRKQQD